jgi:hypothetical protein
VNAVMNLRVLVPRGSLIIITHDMYRPIVTPNTEVRARCGLGYNPVGTGVKWPRRQIDHSPI